MSKKIARRRRQRPSDRRAQSIARRASTTVLEWLEPRFLLTVTRPLGLDVSEFQGTLSQTNWNSIAASKQFVIMRASYGTSSGDAQFTNNAPKALAAGMYVGYYHYAYYDLAGHTPNGEADNFWNHISPFMAADGKHLMPMLDMEEPNQPADGETIPQWINSFCTRLQSDASAAGYSIQPMVYCNVSFATNSLDSTVAQNRPLVIAQWPSTTPSNLNTAQPSGNGVYQNGTSPTYYNAWSFWQYTDAGHVTGIGDGTTTKVDLDVFQGDINSLKDYTINSTPRYAKGTHVQSAVSLTVYPTSTGGTTTSVPANTSGAVIAGPAYIASFMRYRVSFTNGTTGWVADYQSNDPSSGATIDWLPQPDATTYAVFSSITSSKNNGSYNAGNSIPITITFSKAVTVTGTPTLALNDGGVASYTSGSGTNALTFTYTVEAGQNTSDLDYASSTSLSLNGGMITDGTNNAILTLPDPTDNGSGRSLGDVKNIVIDTIAPTVASVSSTLANGSYKAGQVVPITVTFSEIVNVTGIPQLTLNDGAVVNYSSGTGGTTLTFNYTVAAGQNVGDLDYASTSALALNAGSITDVANNAATLTLASPGAAGSLGANKNIVIDTIAPTVTNVTSILTDGSYKAGQVVPITVTFSEIVNVTGTPQLTLNDGAVVGYSSGSGSNTLTFNYTVAAGQNTPALDYASTSALALNSGAIRDAALNNATLTLASPGSPGSLGANKTIVIDTTAPTVTNVASTTTPDGAYGIGTVIPISVTFSEAVTVTGTPQLTLNVGSGTINYASGSSTNTLIFNYTIVPGQSSPDLDYASTTALALNSGTIRDAALNNATLTLAAPGSAGSLGANNNIVVDGIPPFVSASTRNSPSPTNGASVSWNIFFNENVTGVDVTDFSLTGTGSSGAAITDVTGSGSSYVVTASTAGDGTLIINLTDDDSITDAVGNKLGGAGAGNGNYTSSLSFTVDKTPPTVSSINRVSSSPINASSVSWTVTFSDSVTGVDTTDFVLVAGPGLTGTSITNVTGSGSTYTVTANTGSGSDTLGLNLVDDDSIADLATNPLGGDGSGNGDFTGQVYTIDRTAPAQPAAPVLDPSTDSGAPGDNTTNFNQPTFTGAAGAAEANSTITVYDGVNTLGTTTAAGDGSWSFMVPANKALADGSHTITVTASDNSNNTSVSSDALSLTVDTIAPSILSISRDSSSPTNASSVDFAVTFSESVVGVDSNDFNLAASGLTGASISNIAGSGSSYTVTVNTGTGDGTAQLNLASNSTLTDPAGNSISASGFAGQTYSIDKTAPTVSSISLAGPGITNGSSASWTIAFSESVTGLDSSDLSLVQGGMVSGASISNISGSGSSYTVTVDLGSGDGTVELDLVDDDSIIDAAGNPLGGAGAGNGNFNGDSLTIDRTAPAKPATPSLSASTDSGALGDDTTNFNQPTLTAAAGSAEASSTLSFYDSATLLGTAIVANDGSYSFTVPANKALSDGLHSITVISTDAASNSSPASDALSLSIDTAAPTVVSINRAGADPSNSQTVSWTVTFSESVTGVDATDFSLPHGGDVANPYITNIAGSASVYTVTADIGGVDGDGPLGLNLVDDDSITDTAGNPLGGTGADNGDFTGQVYTVDVNPPFPSYGGQTPIPGSATLDFTVAYFDTTGADPSTINANDITVTGPNSYLADSTHGLQFISYDSNSQVATYRIPAPGGTWDSGDAGDYTITLNPNIVKDMAGNYAPGGAFAAFTVSSDFAVVIGSTLYINPDNTNSPMALGYDDNTGLISITEGSTLTFSPDGLTDIIVNGSAQTFAFSFSGPSPMPLPVAYSNGVFDFAADADNGGAPSLTVNSDATLNFNATQHLSDLTIGGHVNLPAGRTVTLVTDGLTINGGALDLSDDAMIVNYTNTAPSNIRTYLQSGRNAPAAQPGLWNGPGIQSSYAHSFGNGFNLAIGYASNTDLASVRASGSYTTFGGQTVGSNCVLVQLTRGADATLDGVVDSQDVTILGSHFNKPNSGQWCFGDFDYSGTCDATDVTTLGSTFGKTTPTLSPAAIVLAPALVNAVSSASVGSPSITATSQTQNVSVSSTPTSSTPTPTKTKPTFSTVPITLSSKPDGFTNKHRRTPRPQPLANLG